MPSFNLSVLSQSSSLESLIRYVPDGWGIASFLDVGRVPFVSLLLYDVWLSSVRISPKDGNYTIG